MCTGILVGGIGFVVYSNHWIGVARVVFEHVFLPEAFDGLKIVQVSDLHGDFPKWKEKRLLKLLEKAAPDIVVITGDVIDHTHHKHYAQMLELVQTIAKRYGTYYVTGNHEYMHKECEAMIGDLQESAVHVLHNEKCVLEKAGQVLGLYGVDDPYMLYHGKVPDAYLTPAKEYIAFLKELPLPEEKVSILLAHRPEFFESYVEKGFSLVFTGHAHGGQWRFPGIRGVMAPDQGMFPKFTGGSYQKDKTTMIVSRGLGNSTFPLRLFNRPEIVCVVLRKKKENDRDH